MLIFSAITVVISILLKMKAKSDSTSTITTSDQQVYHSRPKFNISNYGLKWIIFFLSGASYEILTHSMMTLSMGYNSVVMADSCFHAACFLIYYLTSGYAVFRSANPDRQESQIFLMIRWVYGDSGFRSGTVLLIELSRIAFTIHTAYRRKMDKVVDVVNSSLISF